MNSFIEKDSNRDKLVSILLPTYNESQNIAKMLNSLITVLPQKFQIEIIVIDDDSPDGTGKIAEDYKTKISNENISMKIIHRKNKRGLSSAILDGIYSSTGNIIVVMDSDFSHPSETVEKMLDTLLDDESDIVIGSRFVPGGESVGWPLSRKIMSKFGTKIPELFLNVKVKDSTSGFFSFKKEIVKNINFDALGYKFLLEMLVKTRGAKTREIPYKCVNRKIGSSKFNTQIIIDYIKLINKLRKYKN